MRYFDLVRMIAVDLVEINDGQQTLRCRFCKEVEEILRRRWHREDLKLEAIEQFTEEHEPCAEKRLKLLKIQFFCRPFRPIRAMKARSAPSRRVIN